MSRESDDDQEYRRSGRRTDDGREHRSSGRRTDDGREYRSSGRRGDDDREYRSSGRRADDGREYRRTGRGTDDDREYRSSGRRQNDEMRRSRSGKRASRKKRKKTALTILILAIAVLAAIAIIFFLFLEGTLNSIKRVDKSNEAYVARSDETFEVDSSAGSDTMNADDVDFNAGNIDVMDSDDVKNILLIGQDKRSDQKTRTRSDTMIIASINTKTNKITMVSLMRDMYVPIPGYSANRINAAYVFGGMSLLDQVIKEDFGITIDGNVVVDFDGFLETMTKIGNLDIELTEDEANYMNANEGLGSAEDNASVSEAWGLTAGVNSLTPEQALTYSRMRYVGNSDWERTERQRKLLTAVFKKAQKSRVTKILSMVSDLIPYFETDLSNKEILKYVKTVFSGDIKLNSKSYRIPVDGGYTSQTISGMSVLVPDLEINSAYLQHYLYNKKISESLKEAAKKAEVSTSSDTTTPPAAVRPAIQQTETAPIRTIRTAGTRIRADMTAPRIHITRKKTEPAARVHMGRMITAAERLTDTTVRNMPETEMRETDQVRIPVRRILERIRGQQIREPETGQWTIPEIRTTAVLEPGIRVPGTTGAQVLPEPVRQILARETAQ